MINCENLTKKFDSRGIAGINGVNLQLKAGEIISIMGPNGSGKSTLINIISGKIKADSGTLSIEGEAKLFSPEIKSASINVQKFLIQKITLEMDDEKKIQLSRDLADIFEFTFQLRQNLSELSAGQKQKVLLASELINRPSLILLDEPFTHLDPHTRKEILKSLFTYIKQHETSVLWVTHDLEDAFKFSDRIGILNLGKFEQIASPQNIIVGPKNLFVAQFIGFENFLPIKRISTGWETPWGILSVQHLPDKDEALLLIPAYAIKIVPEGTPVKVVSDYFLGTQRRLNLVFDDKTISAQVSYHFPRFDDGKSLNVTVDLDECLIIPL